MSNSGQKMSTPGWCTFGLLGGVLVVAFGAFASATPQNKSEATLGQAAEKATSYTLVDHAVKVSSKQKPANIRKMSSTATLSAVQTGSSATRSIAGPGERARPSRSNVASATTPPEGLRTAQGDTGPSCATDFLTYDDGDWSGVNGGAPAAGWTDAGTVNDFILPDPDGGGVGTSFTCAQVMLIVDPGNEPTEWVLRVYDLNDVDGAGGGDGTILGMGSFAAAVPKCTRTYTTAGGTLTVVDTGHFAFGRPVMVLDGVGDACDLYDGHFGFHVMFPGIGSFNFWATAPQDGNPDELAVWGPVVDLPASFANPDFQAMDLKIGGVAIDCPNDVCGEGETTCNCPQDCGAEVCGDGVCCAAQGEDCANCPEDCGVCPSCGDGNVDPGEDCDPPGSLCANNELCQGDCTCPAGPGDPACQAGAGDCCSDNGTPGCDDEDCCNCICNCDPFCCGDAGGFWDAFCAGDGFVPPCGASNPDGPCATECSECLPSICGDAVCDADENCCSCEADCGACTCGDGTCDAPCESFDNCPQDCDPPPEGCAPEDLTYDDGHYDAVNGVRPAAGWTDAGVVSDFFLPDPDGGGTGTFFTCAQVAHLVDAGSDPTEMVVRIYDLNDVDGAGGGDGTILGMGSFAAAVPVCMSTYTTAGGTLTVTDTGDMAFGLPVHLFDGVGELCELYDGHFGFHIMFPGLGAVNFWASAPQDGSEEGAVWGPVVDLPGALGNPDFQAIDFRIWGAPPCNNDGVCDEGENSCNCEADCGACAGTCVSGACCGDGVVEGHEECDFAGCGTCPWDTFPVDGDVGAGDLAFLLGNWGLIPKGADPAILCLDAEPDGDIGAFDLANVLGNWGPCPVGFGEDLCVEDDCDAFCECVGRGACCDVKGPGTCDELLTADECAIAGGNYVGDDTTCENCPHPACANADGGCCDANGTPGCDDPDCCAAVCELAPICCDEGWDSLCAGLATDVCAGGCPIPFDNCDSPGTITDGDTSYDTTGGITDGLPHANCQFDGQTYHDIWFNYDATCTGDLTVTTCEDDGGSAVYDTDLVVYDGCFPDIPCPPTDANLLGCNDDSCSVGFHSFLQVAVVANDCYTIRVGGWKGTDQGSGVLHLNCVQGTVCGDLVCEGDETSCSCPADCAGECPCVSFTNQAEFEAFNEANGKTLKGVEDFEEGILGAGAVDGMDDPLCGGVPNAPDAFPYPAGLTQLNMCVQGNTLAGNATDPSPEGIDGLAAASAGFFGASSDIVVANFFADSLDIMLTSPPVSEGEEDDHTAVGFSTLGNLLNAPGTVNIQVYSKANVLLLSASSPSDGAGSNFWGVSCTEPIGRINIFDPVGGSGGADNIQLWEFAGTCGEFGCEDGQGENTCNCPADCGPDTCGNGICCESAGEDCAGCPEDCGDCPSCGDGNCDANEDCASCEADCGVCVGCDICYSNCDDITGPGAPCIDNGADDWMSNVTFAGINNTTGTEGCPCSYGNHSALQASVVAGQTYDLTVSFCSDGQWPQHVRAWFDWNGNLDYECGESVYLGTGIDATLTAPVMVPAGTPSGCYSMRVIEEYFDDPGCSAACTGQIWGEAEDYTVCVN